MMSRAFNHVVVRIIITNTLWQHPKDHALASHNAHVSLFLKANVLHLIFKVQGGSSNPLVVVVSDARYYEKKQDFQLQHTYLSFLVRKKQTNKQKHEFVVCHVNFANSKKIMITFEAA